jgi:hypothetical protein
MLRFFNKILKPKKKSKQPKKKSPPKSKQPKKKVEPKKKIAPKKVWEEIGCSDRTDVFTQEDLPNKRDEVITLNDKKPFHCVELKSFYQYWLSKANDGKDVTNPFTNKEIPEKKLDEIWKQISKKYSSYKKPEKTNVKIVHTWDEQGMQQQLRYPQEAEEDESGSEIYSESENGTTFEDYIVPGISENLISLLTIIIDSIDDNSPENETIRKMNTKINSENIDLDSLYKFYEILIRESYWSSKITEFVEEKLYRIGYVKIKQFYTETLNNGRELFNEIDTFITGKNITARPLQRFLSFYKQDLDERTIEKLNKIIKKLIIKDLTMIKENAASQGDYVFKIFLKIYTNMNFLQTTKYYREALEIFVNSTQLSNEIKTFLEDKIRTIGQSGGARKKKPTKKPTKKQTKKQRKKIRKHVGINQKTGRLNKGYKYSGKILKSGLKQIVKVKK